MCKLLALLAIIVTLASGTSTPSSPVSAENKPPVAKSHPFQAGLPTAPSGSFSHPPSSGLFSTGLPTPITGPSGFNFGFPTPATTTTCRTRPIGEAIYNQCPTGHTLISSGECCPTQQVLPSPTSHSTCFDKANANGINECPQWKEYCRHMFYKSYMTHHCPQTCGLCPATASTTCVDSINPTTGRSECLANIGLCNNASLKDWMKIQCPKTCGYCQ
ncbi:hypothetical protein L3Y34_019067 [Caenorhabditis briggsae]|uniref:ShKT domain-containing protein n=1 Tax=Caenorhabditis briggsae TaxID=6238 RepID=A0AAE9DNY1_CAEBR|nr:hypothetical protein L3Y34_019067 [Caenorhabditis briggsae]